MSRLKVDNIETRSGNNVGMEHQLNLKSYSTTDRDALTSAAGDIIYNSTDNKPQFYDGSSWVDLGAITQGASISVDYLVAGGGGGGGEHGSRGAGGGGAGGVANSYNSETCGRFARSYSSLSLYKNLRYNVSIGSGGAGGTTANVMPYHGNGSSFHTVSVPGGSPGSDGHANGGRAHYGGSGGGGDGNVSSANDALNEGSPNTGGGGGAKGAGSATDAGSGGSGVVILRYPNTATINTIGLTSQTFTEGSDKVTAITAGTGQVYWE